MATAVPIIERRPQPAHDRIERAWQTVRTVSRGYGYNGDEGKLETVFRTLTQSWNAFSPSAPLPWSGLGADASGCDVSMVLGGSERELRVTVEAQGCPASPWSYWDAARKLSEALEVNYGADLTLLRRIEDLFGPFAPEAAGVLWHGAVFRKDRAPWFKIYLHLMSAGRPRTRDFTQSILRRLGLSDVWPDVLARLNVDDELLFLSFDLVPSEDARIKLYIRHANQTPAGLAQACSAGGVHHDREIESFVRILLGEAGRSIHRGALTSLHLKRGQKVPVRAATHVRLYPNCALSDAVLFERMRQAIKHVGIAPEQYEAVISAMAGDDLDRQQGIHGWASLQWAEQDPVVTIYLSPRLHFARYGPIGLDPSQMWPSPLVDVC